VIRESSLPQQISHVKIIATRTMMETRANEADRHVDTVNSKCKMLIYIYIYNENQSAMYYISL